MVFFLAITTKTALTLGAIVGGTVAILANKEKVMEVTADVLQKGADFLNEELNKRKVKMATAMQDGELDFDKNPESHFSDTNLLFSEVTTPETSDQETQTDEEMDSDTFDVESLEMALESFENIKEKEGLLVFERFSGSNSTLIGKLGKDDINMDSDLELD